MPKRETDDGRSVTSRSTVPGRSTPKAVDFRSRHRLRTDPPNRFAPTQSAPLEDGSTAISSGPIPAV
ncbi:hypothetical protein EA472_21695 [Natrarchaeobius oligotrophus]|uniref:Uncharacterized protein n=1 Tax=Natrarchaeobius chitinivorans TaxID=1679083 RepID=A0A3N6MF33_NATCH|nr:hypothetical protein EA472_21695 [Natrarchaeobius chitinivorans]